VGPYDRRLPGLASAMAWFYVAHEPDALPGPEQDPLQAGCTPMALAVRRPRGARRLMLPGRCARPAASVKRQDVEGASAAQPTVGAVPRCSVEQGSGLC